MDEFRRQNGRSMSPAGFPKNWPLKVIRSILRLIGAFSAPGSKFSLQTLCSILKVRFLRQNKGYPWGPRGTQGNPGDPGAPPRVGLAQQRKNVDLSCSISAELDFVKNPIFRASDFEQIKAVSPSRVSTMRTSWAKLRNKGAFFHS